MKRRPVRKSLDETVAENRATLAFMSRLSGAPAPEFHRLDCDVKADRAKERAANLASGVGAKPASNPASKLHPTEAEILKTVLAYLRAHPYVTWVMRVNSGTFVESYGGHERYIQSNSQRGMSDVCGMLKGGKFFALEMKSKTGRLSKDQDDYLVKILQGGGCAGVCRSIEDADKILGFVGELR